MLGGVVMDSGSDSAEILLDSGSLRKTRQNWFVEFDLGFTGLELELDGGEVSSGTFPRDCGEVRVGEAEAVEVEA